MKMVETTKKGLLATAAAGAMVLALGASKADASTLTAFSILEITNFQIVDSIGDPLFQDLTDPTNPANDFSFLDINNTSNTSADLNGANAFSGVLTSGGALDAPLQCLGNQCGGGGSVGENQFDADPIGVGGDNFARGDANLTGALIDLVVNVDHDADPNTPDIPVPVSAGATSQHIAEVELSSTGEGAANGFIGTTTQFTFVLAGDQDIEILLDIYAKSLAEIEDDANGIVATSSTSFKLEITNEVTDDVIFEFDLAELAGGTSAGPVGAGDDDSDQTGTQAVPDSLTSGLVTLPGNTLLSISVTSSAAASGTLDIPEPASLAILGTGLVGFGLIRRRRSAKVAA